MAGSNLLIQARCESLLTQEELAEKMGLSITVVCNWEKDPGRMTIGRIQQLYGIVNDRSKVFLEKFIDDIFLR